MKDWLVPLLEKIKGKYAGLYVAFLFFVLALLWIIFGIWRLLFLVFATAIGYFLGVRYFSDTEKLRELLDQILPPGKFR